MGYKMIKGGHLRCVNGTFCWRSSDLRILRWATGHVASVNPSVQIVPIRPCSPTAGEAALTFVRFYMSPPAKPPWSGF